MPAPIPTSPLFPRERRFLALHLPALPTDRIRRAAPDLPTQRPLGVWATRGPRRVLVAVDRAAAAAGLRAGQALADAQAIAPDMMLVPEDPAADARALDGLAFWARRYTPLAATDPPDGLLLDITGCAHFWGGEAGLREDALLAHALHCRRLAAYLLIARMRWVQSVRAKAQSWEVRDERLDWPDPELTHIRLHRTIYYSLDGPGGEHRCETRFWR